MIQDFLLHRPVVATTSAPSNQVIKASLGNKPFFILCWSIHTHYVHLRPLLDDTLQFFFLPTFQKKTDWNNCYIYKHKGSIKPKADKVKVNSNLSTRFTSLAIHFSSFLLALHSLFLSTWYFLFYWKQSLMIKMHRGSLITTGQTVNVKAAKLSIACWK